jgi:hypothetical protein
MNKEFSRRLESLNSSLVELARARDEWDKSPGPIDTTDPIVTAFERAVAEYETADEDMLEFMSRLTGREIRRTAREPMLRPDVGGPAANAGRPGANASRPGANASRPAANAGRKMSRASTSRTRKG